MTERKIVYNWLFRQLGTLFAPNLLENLFAECDCIVELCVLQRVLASLGEVRGYMVRAELAECSE